MEIKVIPLDTNDPKFPKVEEVVQVSCSLTGAPFFSETNAVPDIQFTKEDGTTIGYRLPPGKQYALVIES